MQRPEKRIALLLVPGILVISLYMAVSYLPVLTIRRIDAGEYPTASMERILLPMVGGSYLSASRNAAADDLISLPYIDDVTMKYEKGTLFVDPAYRNDGIVLVSDSRAAIMFGDDIDAIRIEDVSKLRGIYPVVGISDSYLEYGMLLGFPEIMVSVIRQGADASRSSRLITWMEYGNNSYISSPVLTLTIPDLNASVSVMETEAASRIGESLGIIADEHMTGGSEAVLGSESHYGLYSDRLVRMKRR